MLNCTFSYNKIICIFVLIACLYLFRNLLSYHRALSLPTSNSPRRSEAARYGTFSIELHSYLNPDNHLVGFLYYRCMNLGLMLSKIQEIEVVGSSGTGTTLIGTSTNLVLVSGTGTTLVGTVTILLLHRWYQYHPCLVLVPIVKTAQKWQIFLFSLTFLPYTSSIPSYIKNLQ